MKNKSVMKVQMNCEKCRKKALQIAAGAEGVISVTNEGKDKELISVVGISVDAVCLAGELRKKVGPTELLSVTEVKEEKKDEKKEEKKEKKEPCHCKEKKEPCHCYYWGPPPSFHPCQKQPPPSFHPCPKQPVACYSTAVYDESPSICSVM